MRWFSRSTRFVLALFGNVAVLSAICIAPLLAVTGELTERAAAPMNPSATTASIAPRAR